MNRVEPKTRKAGCNETSMSKSLQGEAMFRTIFENLAWGVEVFDEKGLLINLNKAALEMFGARKEDMLGLSLFDSPHLNDEFKNKLRNGEEVEITMTYDFDRLAENGFYPSVHRGAIKYIKNKAIPLKDEQNNTIGYLLLLFDDTKVYLALQKAKEMELSKSRESDKLKSAFMANISHEIRTPLNAIVGFSTILADTCDLPEMDSYLDVINKNNRLLLQLVDDILDFSQMEMGTVIYKMEEMDAKEVCEAVIRTYQPMLNEGVRLGLAPESGKCMIRTDCKRIRQVLSQLVGNAVKYTEKGHIIISYLLSPEEIFTLQVADTGIGIPKEERDTIFDSFYQVDHFSQGVGMGLAIAKSLIEGLGGMISVTSEVGEGSVFCITLPFSK